MRDETKKQIHSTRNGQMDVQMDLKNKDLIWNHYLKRFVDVLVVSGTVVIIMILLASVYWVYVVSPSENYLIVKLVNNHFPALVGLPASAGLSFMVVWAFSISKGDVELEIAQTIKFKGASAPVLFWVISFFTMSLALSMIW